MSLRTFSCVALGLVLIASGCDKNDAKPASQIAKEDHGHEHHEETHGVGPHNGGLFELKEGDLSKVGEIVVDEKNHALEIYLLGSDGKTPLVANTTEIPLATEGGPTYILKSDPLPAEKPGQSSHFKLVDEKAVHAIADAGFIHGTATIKIGEETFKPFIDAHLDDEHNHGDSTLNPPSSNGAGGINSAGEGGGEPVPPSPSK